MIESISLRVMTPRGGDHQGRPCLVLQVDQEGSMLTHQTEIPLAELKTALQDLPESRLFKTKPVGAMLPCGAFYVRSERGENDRKILSLYVDAKGCTCIVQLLTSTGGRLHSLYDSGITSTLRSSLTNSVRTWANRITDFDSVWTSGPIEGRNIRPTGVMARKIEAPNWPQEGAFYIRSETDEQDRKVISAYADIECHRLILWARNAGGRLQVTVDTTAGMITAITNRAPKEWALALRDRGVEAFDELWGSMPLEPTMGTLVTVPQGPTEESTPPPRPAVTDADRISDLETLVRSLEADREVIRRIALGERLPGNVLTASEPLLKAVQGLRHGLKRIAEGPRSYTKTGLKTIALDTLAGHPDKLVSA